MLDDPLGLLKDAGTAIAGAGIGLFFGILAYLQAFIGPNPPKFSWLFMIIKGLTAAAVGWGATDALIELGYVQSHPHISGILIAISGWGGPETINVAKESLYSILRSRFGGPQGGSSAG